MRWKHHNVKHEWLQQLILDTRLTALQEALRPGSSVRCGGGVGSLAWLLAGALHATLKRPVLLVVAHLDDADDALDDLGLFDALDALCLPAMEGAPGEGAVNLELLTDRLSVARRLIAGNQPHVIVAPIQALMQPIPDAASIEKLSLELKPGQPINRDELTRWLENAGYRRADAVDEPGDYAARGGIVDIFPPDTQAVPIRIDLLGDTIESISEIDPESMKSASKLDTCLLMGASLDPAVEGSAVIGVWETLSPDTIVVFHEPLEIEEQARGYFERLIDASRVISPKETASHLTRFASLEVSRFLAPESEAGSVSLPSSPLADFERDATKAISELCELSRSARVVVLCPRRAEADRLYELLSDHGPSPAPIEIVEGSLHRGFLWESDADRPLAVIPHHELFHRYAVRRRLRRVGQQRGVDGFLDIEPGCYVVHTHHGIARYHGLKLMTRGRDGTEQSKGGETQEFLTLEFAKKAVLRVPASQIDLVHRYVGGFSGKPTLSTLGGTRWKKLSEQAAVAAESLAEQLLRIQAARGASSGIRYPQDTPWVKRFEAEFPYEETDDQLAAAAEIKKDMCDSQPMDRLLCGDVGYGKTELAMRAAFKAAEAGHQVAILCPTTVLCEQHGRTFHERMADYPFRVAVLSRLRSTAESRAILEGLADGSIDIVIGTHRLLSDDVTFADLGLVVVDEEQRFGVEHKNKLMRFRLTVDVLTLSATPIPRTLHMALLGMRDISSLSTPPADRRAVVTEVLPFDPKQVRRAILRELNRDGQCFFVHNRVHNIHAVADELAALVPEARIVVGHGQMPGSELEDVMLKFVMREADILVCTTIIESGIDIPTANTMFIADCDRFGLAELHQLRGRVGRYKNRAYCYLLLPKRRHVSPIAMKRLDAIERFSTLGSGFRIAMRDMELRGVGNLLGPEQSGHIAAVGYVMYCQLLEEASAKRRGESAIDRVETHIELGIVGHIPIDYISSENHRILAYRRIAQCVDATELHEVQEGLRQAYGEPPAPVTVLLTLAALRAALGRLGVESLKLEGQDLVFATKTPRPLSEKLANAKGSVRLIDQPTNDSAGTIYYRPPKSYMADTASLLNILRARFTDPSPAPRVRS